MRLSRFARQTSTEAIMSLFPKNMGGIDRVLRFIVGAALIWFAALGPATGYNWIGWIGVIPVVTALLGTCPAYTLLGLSTCPATARRA